MADELPDSIPDFDVTSASSEAFARAVFDRSIGGTPEEEDRAPASGTSDPWYSDKVAFVQACTALFERFGALTTAYSLEQIDQGLWSLHGDPYFLPFYLTDEEVPPEVAIGCVRAAYHLYADFLALRRPEQHIGALYMWWDEGWPRATIQFLGAVLQTLERILALPEGQCRRAALHGLAHHKDWDETAARAVIDRFLESERKNLTEDEIAYAEFCRDEFHV